MHDLIEALVRDMGPLVEEVEAIEQLGPHRWAIGLVDGGALSVDYSEQTGKLVLAADCGQPQEGNRLQVYETLLTYNSLWEETGGLRMALDRAGGGVVLALDLAPQALTAGLFATVVQNFAAHARLWKRAVQDLGDTMDTPPPPSALGIRV